MNLELNDEQWKFIFKHYPEYASNPYEILQYFYSESQGSIQISDVRQSEFKKVEKTRLLELNNLKNKESNQNI